MSMIAEQTPARSRSTAFSGEIPPEETLMDITHAFIVSRCLHVVAQLGVADALDDAPIDAVRLATAVGADPDALGRVVRLLAGYGIFAVRNGNFTHTSASRLLRTDNPRSMRADLEVVSSPPAWATIGALMHTLRTGRPSGEDAYPGGFWAYLAENPDAATLFNTAMASKARSQVAGVLASYDFSGVATIGDVGGGRGHLLRAILEQAPTVRGVLFDLPHVIEETREPPADRLTLQSGDFFKDALPICELYVLMEVIHDWADPQALAILEAIRRSAPSGARLLVIERMVSDEPGPDFVRVLDVAMLALVGGRQRSRQEYVSLLSRSGFALERQIDTGADIAILEAISC
jgi:hypothetical protein